MKKILIFGAVILILFGGLAFVTTYQNNQKAEGNVYGKSDLDPATIDQLDDPNYQNIILPDELEKKLENKEDTVVYFFSPLCEHCKATTPVLMPIADEVGVEINQLNLLEFEDAWQQYNITGTPTLVHYQDGKEVARSEGSNTEEAFRSLLNDWKAE
ncbi:MULTISPECIES: thioredoxin family protein [Bacillaceae]|uniref:Thioredoxin family protein n=1 Tax=Metabacillus endolithicus TaxID=1535204 RepID=A0ABW5C5D3_9BACI|nr:MULTISPECIES: thioredoxin family protein [Bacillaceae]PGT80742.1 thiol reductase thioredoxin [Bacillus sp. AFS040349]UPG62192.1 thioredoxin family protein [Metabacillus endolithicus]